MEVIQLINPTKKVFASLLKLMEKKKEGFLSLINFMTQKVEFIKKQRTDLLLILGTFYFGIILSSSNISYLHLILGIALLIFLIIKIVKEDKEIGDLAGLQNKAILNEALKD